MAANFLPDIMVLRLRAMTVVNKLVTNSEYPFLDFEFTEGGVFSGCYSNYQGEEWWVWQDASISLLFGSLGKEQLGRDVEGIRTRALQRLCSMKQLDKAVLRWADQKTPEGWTCAFIAKAQENKWISLAGGSVRIGRIMQQSGWWPLFGSLTDLTSYAGEQWNRDDLSVVLTNAMRFAPLTRRVLRFIQAGDRSEDNFEKRARRVATECGYPVALELK